VKVPKKTCPTCGAKMVEYRHAFSKGIAVGLLRLYYIDGPTKLGALELTYNQRCNFQKARYWELAEIVSDPENGTVNSHWQITDLGRRFVEGDAKINRSVWTYRADRVRFEGKLVSFKDFHDGYKKRPDYAREARPHSDPYQPDLL